MPPRDNTTLTTPTAPKGAQRWRIELLGQCRAVPLGDDGNPCGEPVTQFRTHKAALLLARLVLLPHRAHARDELADWLWPDAPADRGRASLTQTLVYLRHALNQPRTGGVFVADHHTVRVAPHAFQTDVAGWEADACRALAAEDATRVEDVLSAYTGDLLPGFYDEWVDNERSRLATLRDALQARLQTFQTAPAVAPTPVEQAAGDSGEPFVNSPLFLTRFFGRDAECEIVRGLLTQNPLVRLVTLLGMGGIGKTRIAVEIAQFLVGTGEGNAPAPFGWAAFVPLAEAQTANHMESLLLATLGLHEAKGLDDAAHYLNARCAGKCRVLLVLDNLEQLGAEAAPVVARLLALVPRLTVLATSRQPVGIVGEREIFLGPLDDNANAARQTPESAASVRLFVDRARLVRPDFSLTPENRDTIFTLCTFLEGVPLALELAAAWARILTPHQMVARLTTRFDLLQRRGAFGGDIPLRHQSLHAAIAWSYDLLPPLLQTFWAQLSVFRGGWTANAAQTVCGGGDASEPLLLLVERSLLVAETDAASQTVRYRMLESLREFAHEQAEATGRESCDSLRLRHARYFDTLSREANTLIETGRGMRPALALLGPERDNLRIIFARLHEKMLEPTETSGSGGNFVGFAEAAAQSVVQSHWLWPVNEAHSFLTLCAEATSRLPHGAGQPLRARVLMDESLCSMYAGDAAAAERQGREALALWETLQDQENIFAAKKRLASLLAQNGDRKGGIALWMECLQFAQETNNPHLEAGILNNLANHGMEVAQRQAWIERAVALDRVHAPGSHYLACSLNTMGITAFEQKDWETARTCLEEAHDVAAADGAAGMIGVTKMSLAGFFCERNEALDRADRLLCEAQTVFEEKNEPLRVAQVHLMRFEIALKRGDGNAALCHARDYLCLSRDTGLLTAEALASTQTDRANQLRNAGFAAQAAGLEGIPT